MSVKQLMMVVSLVIGVSACSSHRGGASHQADHHGSISSWGNYKCVASNQKSGGHRAIGWATNKRAAQDSALSKCRAHSAQPQSCEVLSCHSD